MTETTALQHRLCCDDSDDGTGQSFKNEDENGNAATTNDDHDHPLEAS
jgi:hypothetical protein